jgi:hypothetical protein
MGYLARILLSVQRGTVLRARVDDVAAVIIIIIIAGIRSWHRVGDDGRRAGASAKVS